MELASRHDVFPTRPVVGLLGFLGQLPNLVPATNLRRLLIAHLKFTRLEDAPVPLHVVATDVLSGHDVLLSAGDAVDAIAASTAIPAVLPPVRIGGRALMDGGVVNNTPLSHAVALRADIAYVPADRLRLRSVGTPSRRHGDGAARSDPCHQPAARGRHHPIRADHRRAARPSALPVHISPIDFSHALDLIEQARRETRRWLARPTVTGQAVLLAPHRH